MVDRPLHRRFRDLDGFTERHTQDDLRDTIAALFLQHRDLEHYAECTEGDVGVLRDTR